MWRYPCIGDSLYKGIPSRGIFPNGDPYKGVQLDWGYTYIGAALYRESAIYRGSSILLTMTSAI